MSTSRVSLIGLPLSIDSRTASSRPRSWMIRAIRKRYFARSRPGIRPQTRVWARRAALTAASMSASSASATSASTSSVDGLIVLKLWPWPSTNSPFTKRPYDGLMSTIPRDSGAGAYSNTLLCFAIAQSRVK